MEWNGTEQSTTKRNETFARRCIELRCIVSSNDAQRYDTQPQNNQSLTICNAPQYTIHDTQYTIHDTAVFLFLHLSVLAVVWATKMNCQLGSYTRQSVWSYATANVQQSGLSFTLFWTLFYGLVYLY